MHLRRHLRRFANDAEFRKALDALGKELAILVNLNLDPVLLVLQNLYCPTIRKDYRDPDKTLRSLLLMTLLKESSVTAWVNKTRASSVLAVMAGFDPDNLPGVGTYYDFMKRLIDGPYRKPVSGETRRSVYNAGRHARNLKEQKGAGKDELNPHQSQSRKLVDELLARADEPLPKDFTKTLDDLLMRLGIEPSIEAGLLKNLDNLAVSGDGSILETAASASGKPICDCRSQGIYRCNHDRSYTNPTAQWCYDHHHERYVFGDRYYLMMVHQNGRDLPIQVTMPGGNESDYTLSLKALDRKIKYLQENNSDLRIGVFLGDGHHDSYAHYEYLEKKGIVPIIPLTQSSRKVYPHLLEDRGVRMDADGVPLCPAGVRMRHHQYDKNKHNHVYCCPVKRSTHSKGTVVYVSRVEECPRKQDCAPGSTLGPIVHIKSRWDPRLFPPIPRSSEQFKELMNQRTACERGNALIDSHGVGGSCRNADYGLIRLNLVAIVHHAAIRYMEARKKTSAVPLIVQALDKIGVRFSLPRQAAG